MKGKAECLSIGVDLGGTKVEAVAVRSGASTPSILARQRIATERDLGYAHIVTQTRDIINAVAREAGFGVLPPVGVGMPGSITHKRADGTTSDVPLVKNSNTTCLNGKPFRADLERAVRGPVTFANDANCFALAEATWGAGRDARTTFGVILGTGVGGGIVLRDRDGSRHAWDGAQGIAGEWGHVVLDPKDGPPCYCGKRGCVETYLSGPAIAAGYETRTGTRLSAADIFASSDRAATAFVRELLDIFGRAMANVIDILDPDVIVLGGGVSNATTFYDEGRRAIARWTFTDHLTTRLAKHELGDSAGVLGAALIA